MEGSVGVFESDLMPGSCRVEEGSDPCKMTSDLGACSHTQFKSIENATIKYFLKIKFICLMFLKAMLLCI